MKFYEFRQNNSGGSFDGPVHLFIEASSAEEANEIAQRDHGVYFDGCDDGTDCSCCGDRWYPVRESDATDKLEVYFYQPGEGYVTRPAENGMKVDDGMYAKTEFVRVVRHP